VGATETPAAPAAAAPATPAAEAATPEQTKRLRADIIITRHTALAAGAGLIPLPLVDFSAVLTVQVSMLYLLCDIWGTEETKFSKQAATSIALSAVGSAIPGLNARSLFLTSALKAIPFVGTAAAVAATPALAGATTLALGKLFVEHLESRGTLLTFRASRIKEYAKRLVTDAEKIAKADVAAA
jgi:uncharacterized protein (DUF697 family)